MKYYTFIFILIITGCREIKKSEKESEYAFEHYDSKYDYLNQIDLVKDQNTNIKNKENTRLKDSLQRVANLRTQLQKDLLNFYKDAGYKPSTTFDHLKHIRKYSIPKNIGDNIYKYEYFIDYVINHCLDEPTHTKYLTDRRLLKKLNSQVCSNYYLNIVDTLENGKRISISIKSKEFKAENHDIKINIKNNYIDEIDEKYPFGAVYYANSVEEIIEIDEIVISIDDKLIQTGLNTYKNLYNPNFCNIEYFRKIIEAFEDGDKIYIYIFGGYNAGTYFSKLIFDIEEGYIGKIVTDYIPLSSYGSFYKDFIGY